MLGIHESELWQLTPRDFEAAQAANVQQIRLEWRGIARALAGYFEGSRVDPKTGAKLPGEPITTDDFLPEDPYPEPIDPELQKALDSPEYAALKARHALGSTSAKGVPKWATAPGKQRSKKTRKQDTGRVPNWATKGRS